MSVESRLIELTQATIDITRLMDELRARVATLNVAMALLIGISDQATRTAFMVRLAAHQDIPDKARTEAAADANATAKQALLDLCASS